MIIIDENVDQVLIDRLGTENFETFSIRHQHAGISDREVIHIAKEEKGSLLQKIRTLANWFSHIIFEIAQLFYCVTTDKTMKILSKILCKY